MAARTGFALPGNSEPGASEEAPARTAIERGASGNKKHAFAACSGAELSFGMRSPVAEFAATL
ncbi:hypothetical protein CC073_10165 [Salmonella enterica]|nr:hypothetical protein [Salmonella enterica]EBS7156337.1 hypothetical protein [Salmonella enterica]